MNSSFQKLNKTGNDGKPVLPSFELPDPRNFDTYVCKDLPDTYTIDQDDSNKYLVFNAAVKAVLHIPDNMYRGTRLIVSNVGEGYLEVVMNGLEELKGISTFANNNSPLFLNKITENLWQPSVSGVAVSALKYFGFADTEDAGSFGTLINPDIGSPFISLYNNE